MVLLAVNADVPEKDPSIVRRSEGELPRWGSVAKLPWLAYPLPIGSVLPGIESLNIIHATNKRRSEQVASERMEKLVRLSEPKVEVYYFPVHLMQLSPSDPNTIKSAEATLFDRLKGISTDFVISSEKENTLKEAAETILNATQEEGWLVGWCQDGDKLEEVHQLGRAFAYALVRSQAKNWNDCASPAEGQTRGTAQKRTRERLVELNNLFSKGLVFPEEYQQKLREILRSASPAIEERFEQLNDLYNKGLIPSEQYKDMREELLREL